MQRFDKIILGGGLYGLYSALYCGKQGQDVLLLEYDDKPFSRATYINQARVHMGYHYPRSYSTAKKSALYFQRFVEDYGFCVLKDFEQVYATSSQFSWTSGIQFKKFCDNAGIRCDLVSTDKYFNTDLCDNAFITQEYTYDAHLLKVHLLKQIEGFRNIVVRFSSKITSIENHNDDYLVRLEGDQDFVSGFILNATYASINQIQKYLSFEPFNIKYELCEIILCKVSDSLKDVGLTVMDGPFFSIMPFGMTGLHSLTSVTFTPHLTSYDAYPSFICQKGNEDYCSPNQLGNCNNCANRPSSAWPYMSSLARKYMNNHYSFEYESSLFSMKPILKASEIDDSRPTVIRRFSTNPTFISVLSGKINTLYDLNEVLDHE